MERNVVPAIGAIGLLLLTACGGGGGSAGSSIEGGGGLATLIITSSAPPSSQVATRYHARLGPTCMAGSSNCVCIFAPLRPSCHIAQHGYQLAATGGTTPYSFKWAAAAGSALPPGLTLSAAGLIDGLPTTVGSYGVVVTVFDSEVPAAQAGANYLIVVTPPPPPQIDTVNSPSAVVNLPYTFNFTASYGQPPLTWSETGPLPTGLSFNSDGTLLGTPGVTGSFPVTVMVHDSVGQNATPQSFTVEVTLHGFVMTGSMETPRSAHSATLLSNGMVLVAGGTSTESSNALATAELYDPNSGTFAATGSMQAARSSHTATLLSPLLGNGNKVLVTGGSSITAAELFDPSSGTFTPTGSMEAARFSHTATLLNDGTVLVAGGANEATIYATAELFDPSSGAFKPTGSMVTARYVHTATLLENGMVLVVGGAPVGGGPPTATAELFDPKSGTFTPTGSMVMARFAHAATLLPNGKVLVTGGLDSGGTPVATAELFDPSNGTFRATGSMKATRAYQGAALLDDGTVLVIGGEDAFGDTIASAELFAPSGTFSATGPMGTSRMAFTSTLLQDGEVLVTGGNGGLSSAELYK
jgi:Galactose oxidase, central domain